MALITSILVSVYNESKEKENKTQRNDTDKDK